MRLLHFEVVTVIKTHLLLCSLLKRSPDDSYLQYLCGKTLYSEEPDDLWGHKIFHEKKNNTFLFLTHLTEHGIKHLSRIT